MPRKARDIRRRFQRFCSHETLKSATFSDSDDRGNFRGFAWQWFEQNNCEENLSHFVKKAANGIFIEGNILGHTKKAKELQQQLLRVQFSDRRKIGLCCVHMYTKDTFLYRIINTTLRIDDQSKLNTLGPFCYLLKYVGLLILYPKHIFERTVYRAANLSEDEIRQYQLAITDKHPKQWLSFTSTTKNRQMALHYGCNTLFNIKLPIHEYSFGIDISLYSKFPEEEEVLLPTQICFHVKHVEFNTNHNIYIIHLDMNILKKD